VALTLREYVSLRISTQRSRLSSSLDPSRLTMASSSSETVIADSRGGAAGSGRKDMGMFDNVVVLDESLRCPHGHRVEGFQTKSFADPTMDTYLVEGPRVYLVVGSCACGCDGRCDD
jgi:hypothetical protein